MSKGNARKAKINAAKRIKKFFKKEEHISRSVANNPKALKAFRAAQRNKKREPTLLSSHSIFINDASSSSECSSSYESVSESKPTSIEVQELNSVEDAEAIYKDFRDNPRTIRILTPFGPVSLSKAIFGTRDIEHEENGETITETRRQGMIKSKEKDYPGTTSLLTYDKILKALTEDGEISDVEIATEILASLNVEGYTASTSHIKQSLQKKRAAAELIAIGFTAETLRDRPANELFLNFLSNVAQSNNTFNEIKEEFPYASTAEEGRRNSRELRKSSDSFSSPAGKGTKLKLLTTTPYAKRMENKKKRQSIDDTDLATRLLS